MSGRASAGRARPIYELSQSRPPVHRHETTSIFQLASPRKADRHDIGAIGRLAGHAIRATGARTRKQSDDGNGDEIGAIPSTSTPASTGRTTSRAQVDIAAN
jgi:hypothetical protein